LSQDACAVSVPPALVESTIRVAALVAAGSSAAGIVSSSVLTLTEGVLKAMLLAKLKMVVLSVAAVAVFTTGVGVLAQDPGSDQDRLKNVERKLDRLLEMLGGSSLRAPVQALVPKAGSASSDATVQSRRAEEPATYPQGRASAIPSTASAVPVPARPDPPEPPAPPAAPADPFTRVLARDARPESWAARIVAVEKRLSDLERRIGDLERRLPHNGFYDQYQLVPPRAVEPQRK
jgi:hypothetical protein